MKWAVRTIKSLTPEGAYLVLKGHRLMPASVDAAVLACKALAASDLSFELVDENEAVVARAFVGGMIEKDSAGLDFIPVSRYFRSGFDGALIEAMAPVLSWHMDRFGLRRLTAIFPSSRPRTERALCALGFVVEGRIRKGAVLYDGKVEDLKILGLLREDLVLAGTDEGEPTWDSSMACSEEPLAEPLAAP